MEKNKLDKLFQDKFTEREFEFQNSYWEDAEALIEATEKGRRKRLLGWISGMLLLLVFVVFGWYITNQNTPKIVEANFNETVENNKAVEQNLTNAEIEEIGNSTNNETENNPNLSLEKDISEKQNNGFNDKNSATGNATAFSEKTQEKEKLAESYNLQNEKRADFTEISKAEYNVSDFKSETYEVYDDLENRQKNKLPFQKSPPRNQAKKTDENSTFNSEKPLEKAVGEVSLIDYRKSGIERNNVVELNYLNHDIALVKGRNQLNRSLQNVNIDKNKYPLKSHRWQLQATAGVSVIPNPKRNDQSLANVFGGLRFGYRISPNLSLQTGLAYQVTQLDAMISESSRQISYAFGKQDDLVYLQTNQLHFLELPFLVGYQVGKTQFSAGLKTGKLLASNGKTVLGASKFPFERTEEENADFNLRLIEARDNNQEKPVFRDKQEGESGWLATDNFKTWQFSLVGEYQFQVAPKFALGIGLEYRLNQHYLKNETGNNAPLYVQFFTTYRIFN